jgi:hypothetical protein
MFCPNCGANNADTATICVQCNQAIPLLSSTPEPPPPPATPTGVPDAPATPGAPPPKIADVPNYLVFSIIQTVVSLMCCGLTCGIGFIPLALAVIALIFSIQVNSKLGKNDLAGAQASSKNAKLFNWITCGLLVGAIVLYFLLVFFGAMSNYWEHRF